MKTLTFVTIAIISGLIFSLAVAGENVRWVKIEKLKNPIVYIVEDAYGTTTSIYIKEDFEDRAAIVAFTKNTKFTQKEMLDKIEKAGFKVSGMSTSLNSVFIISWLEGDKDFYDRLYSLYLNDYIEYIEPVPNFARQEKQENKQELQGKP